MTAADTLYAVESEKSVSEFVKDFDKAVVAKGFVIKNKPKMNMKETLTSLGGEVPDDFDLHMIQLCKPNKADKSLTFNLERAVLMPKFVHVFTKDEKTQIRYLSQTPEYIAEIVPGDDKFPESLTQTFSAIRAMIDEAR